MTRDVGLQGVGRERCDERDWRACRGLRVDDGLNWIYKKKKAPRTSKEAFLTI